MRSNLKNFLTFMVLTLLILSCQKQKEEPNLIHGRVLEYDPNTQSVLIIKDKNNNHEKPDFNTLPPQRFDLPKELIEKGSEPTSGYRISFEPNKRQITLYNPSEKNFLTIDVKVIEQKMNIQRDDPLVYDIAKQKPKSYIHIDKTTKRISLYSIRQKLYVTFEVDEKYINLPEKAWLAGDYVKIYYKDSPKAIKFVNITKTDLLKFKSEN